MIRVDSLHKSYETKGSPLPVLRDITLTCSSGEIVTIVGPSGCGKTTLLNILAGLDSADGGTTSVDGKVGYMMQSPVLLPWRTLAENASLSAEIENGSRLASASLLVEHFSAFGLSDALDTYPQTASGGMKQRVALIRTLMTAPSVLLLDEPFSGLDFDIKLKVQQFLLAYQQRLNATVCFITHDIEDAIALSNRIIVLSRRPAVIKATIQIELGLSSPDPIEARKSTRFAKYFSQVWEEIKQSE